MYLALLLVVSGGLAKGMRGTSLALVAHTRDQYQTVHRTCVGSAVARTRSQYRASHRTRVGSAPGDRAAPGEVAVACKSPLSGTTVRAVSTGLCVAAA
eukprot:3984-Rhodomonas_salina.2